MNLLWSTKKDKHIEWYMHNTESVLENEMHKLLPNCGLSCPGWPQSKIKRMGPWQRTEKLWNMKVTVIPNVIGALDSITKGLVQGLEDLEIRKWVGTIETTALLRLARILRRVRETWGNLLSLKLQWETIG